MEAFTSGLVSSAAVRCSKQSSPWIPATHYERVRGGLWRMYAWESQIAMARAMGRGDADGRGRPHHRADRAR